MTSTISLQWTPLVCDVQWSNKTLRAPNNKPKCWSHRQSTSPIHTIDRSPNLLHPLDPTEYGWGLLMMRPRHTKLQLRFNPSLYWYAISLHHVVYMYYIKAINVTIQLWRIISNLWLSFVFPACTCFGFNVHVPRLVQHPIHYFYSSSELCETCAATYSFKVVSMAEH